MARAVQYISYIMPKKLLADLCGCLRVKCLERERERERERNRIIEHTLPGGYLVGKCWAIKMLDLTLLD